MAKLETFRRHFLGDISFHGGVTYPNVKALVYRDDPYPYPPDPIVVGVFGSAGQGYDIEGSKFKEAAFEIGREIASYRGEGGIRMVLLNGACPGLPHDAAKGARKENGFVVGITAADSYETHRRLLSVTLPGGDEEARELVKEQEEIYNIIVFPHYELPKAVAELQQIGQDEFKDLYRDFIGNCFPWLLDHDELSKVELYDGDVTAKPVQLMLKIYEDISKFPSDIAKNMLKWRNPLNTELSDVCIGIAGSAGTLSELAMAYHPNYSIIGLYSPNKKRTIAGIKRGRLNIGDLNTADLLYLFHDKIGKRKNENQSVVYDDNPKRLVSKLAEELTRHEVGLEIYQRLLNLVRKKIGEKEKEEINVESLNIMFKDLDLLMDEKPVDFKVIGLMEDELNLIPRVRYHPSMEKPLRKQIIEPILKKK